MPYFEVSFPGVNAEVSEAFDGHLIDHFDCFGTVIDHLFGKCEVGDDRCSEGGADANLSLLGDHADLKDCPAPIAHLLNEGEVTIHSSSAG